MMQRFFLYVAVATLIAALSGAAEAAEAQIKVAQKQGLGSFLTDGSGMTLYYFAKDRVGNSVCLDDCVMRWPIVGGENVVAEGVAAKDFGSFTRADGVKQITFRGYPLYTFFRDGAPGDTNGQGVGGVWFVVDPAAFPPK